jgi:hypothetical protein
MLGFFPPIVVEWSYCTSGAILPETLTISRTYWNTLLGKKGIEIVREDEDYKLKGWFS